MSIKSNNYTKELQKLINKYKKHSEKVEENTKKFKEKLLIINKKNGEISHLTHNPLEYQKDNYLWFVFNSIKMGETFDNNKYIGIFITLTLPTQYHRFLKKQEKINPNFKSENTISKGYDLLQQSHRELYKNFRINRKVQKVHFNRVVEPHHDFTPHLHGIYFIEKTTKSIRNFKKHLKNIIEKNGLGNQYDFEIIKDIKKTSGYISKYIRKTQNPNNIDDFHLINGWKKTHKIRTFSSSLNFIPRYVFKKVNSILKLSKDLENTNPINEILNNCDIKINTYNLKDMEIIKKEKYGNEKGKYRVVINRTREIKDKWEIIEKDINNISYEELIEQEQEEMEIVGKTYNYKIIEFKIYQGKKLIYDKNQFELLEQYEHKKMIENKIQKILENKKYWEELEECLY